MAQVVRGKVEKKGSNTTLLLGLLAVLVGLSAWNYHRNLTAEKDVPKSAFSGVSTADLEVLKSAYQSEVDALTAKGGLGGRATARATTGGVAGGAREFERVQRAMRSTREKGYAIAERQAAIAAIEQEQAQRGSTAGTPWQVFLRRTFSF
ncbi:MAG TPA: hypothetical protein VNF72_17480 [Myxococcota bacterium]|nr:hypothetical protein [Myxococcota bacterium]